MAKKAIKKRRGRPAGKRNLVSKAKRALDDIKAGRYKVGTFKVDKNGVMKLHWTQRRKMEREALDEVRAKLIKAVEAAPKQDGWSVVHDNAEQANLKDAEAKRAWENAQAAKAAPAPSCDQVVAMIKSKLSTLENERILCFNKLRSVAGELQLIDHEISKLDEQILQLKTSLISLDRF